MDSSSPDSASAVDTAQAAHETGRALRNAAKLAMSLIGTVIIGIGGRALMQRHLGPEAFGSLNYADAVAGAFFVVLSLGIEMYIYKEVAVRPEHANDFVGTVILLRAGLTVLLVAAMTAWLISRDRPVEVVWVAIVFGAAQLCTNFNNTFTAILHACGKVDGIAVVNFVARVLWGATLVAAAWLNAPLVFFALALVASELWKALWAYRLSRKHAGFVFKVDFAKTKKVLKDATPFFMNAIALAGIGKLDVMVLGDLTNDTEVGWYGSAWSMATITMLMTPIVGWVITPMLSRAATRSQAELSLIMRRGLEACLAVSIPLSLGIFVGADLWIHILGGDKYLPATTALRVLSVTFGLTYVNIFASLCLTAMNRGWDVTVTSLLTLVLSPVLNWIFIPIGMNAIGPSGGATASATAVVVNELIVVSMMMARIGKLAIDGRLLAAFFKTLLVCGGVIVADRLMTGLFAPLRVVLDGLLYMVGVLLVRAVRIEEVKAVLKLARGKGESAPVPA
ncbi:MAG: flippase [Myxococcaceae bacterium]|nr:flippase [Myxococcaceae bacterium]